VASRSPWRSPRRAAFAPPPHPRSPTSSPNGGEPWASRRCVSRDAASMTFLTVDSFPHDQVHHPGHTTLDTMVPQFHIKRWPPSVPRAAADSCACYPSSRSGRPLLSLLHSISVLRQTVATTRDKGGQARVKDHVTFRGYWSTVVLEQDTSTAGPTGFITTI
jgi:hypothetical protein